MKKLFAVLLVVTMLASMATVVSAENTTTLTTTVPASTYTLNIPADQEIAFGAGSTSIGNVTITDSTNFAEGKNVEVTMTYDGKFASNEVSTTIPYSISATATVTHSGGTYGSGGTDYVSENKPSGSVFIFKGLTNGKCKEFFEIGKSGWSTNTDTIKLNVGVSSASWGKALAGEYSTTITFTSEIVVEE